MSDCFCGSGSAFELCCQPFLRGEREATTAEALMRARYSAFATGTVDYIVRTLDPRRRRSFDENTIREWALNSEWHGLEIKATKDGAPENERGTVEFIARYSQQGVQQEHHEVAEFRKENDRWYFVDGKVSGATPFVRTEPKIGRNDPCSCGSGKKFKKCCGQ
jgi:SEC-C motif domain protein